MPPKRIFCLLSIFLFVTQRAKSAWDMGSNSFIAPFVYKDPLVQEKEQQKQKRLQEIRGSIQAIISDPLGNLDTRMAKFNAPLIECARELTLNDLLKELLLNGANPNIKCIVWGSPLHACCQDIPNVAGAELLLNSGANVDTRMTDLALYNRPPLSRSAEYMLTDLVKLFLERGADPDLEDLGSRGDTPLLYALVNSKRYPQTTKVIIGLLLFYGADPLKCNKSGDNAIVVAKNLELPTFAVLLANAQKNLRANLTKVLSRGNTPFDKDNAALIAHHRYSYSEIAMSQNVVPVSGL